MVRPKFCRVSARDLCARASNSASDFGAMSRSKCRTSADFSNASLSKISANDMRQLRGKRILRKQGYEGFCHRHEADSLLRPAELIAIFLRCGREAAARCVSYLLTVNGTEYCTSSHVIFNTPPPPSFFSTSIVN